MKPMSIHPPSLLAGCGICVLALFAMGQQGPGPSAPKLEFKIVADPEHKDLAQLEAEGWDYAGYLGGGKKGAGNDETLWKRPRK